MTFEGRGEDEDPWALAREGVEERDEARQREGQVEA